ncbi:MAG: hypothetical protein ABI977_06815 [Acidobacteriota bacterium]
MTVRIGVLKKQSSAGNAYYIYEQHAVPLLEGLATFIKVEGTIVPMGKIKLSAIRRNPMPQAA